METVAFCEIDPYCQKVLKKHWPNIPILNDVKSVTGEQFAGTKINVVCGGFPCQDISINGKGEGIEGARSGLWSEMLRIIREVRPRWVIAENVPAIRTRGADRVISDLEQEGYHTTPLVVGAWAVGGNHTRDRAWFVAYNPSVRMEGLWPERFKEPHNVARETLPLRNSNGQWEVEPDLWRASDDVRRRLDADRRGRPVPYSFVAHRLKCLGNAVVPHIPFLIGRTIIQVDNQLYADEILDSQREKHGND